MRVRRPRDRFIARLLRTRRVSLRTAMVGVAVAALALSCGVMAYRKREYERRAWACFSLYQENACRSVGYKDNYDRTFGVEEHLMALLRERFGGRPPADPAAAPWLRDPHGWAMMKAAQRPGFLRLRRRYAEIADHHLRLHHKYLRAAGRPWLPVAPDPPPPG